ncbi:MAG TPA: D-aminoacyl-tRNA deacylase [Burkholderiales bacterium]|nr:D-aminoacyl-tRNA deacylase [Burkholderiales bacterium]
MIAVLQRVTRASVSVASERVGGIGHGLLVLVGVEQGDRRVHAERMIERVLTYRVFADAEGRMNRSLADVQGGLLLVPQFTLAADTHKGTRPSFSSAAPPDEGERLFNYLLALAGERHAQVAAGRFGADMQVELVNDGPVTFVLRVAPD